MKIVSVLIIFVYCRTALSLERYRSGYDCDNGRCKKAEGDYDYSFYECRMLCGNDIATVWPRPSGNVSFERVVSEFDLSKIIFNAPPLQEWDGVKRRFLKQLSNKAPYPDSIKSNGKFLNVSIEHKIESGLSLKLDLDVDESYTLEVTHSNDGISAKIIAFSFFGARHGVETLTQLIYYDEISEDMKILATVKIHDEPKFKWRGIAVDTARNFISVNTIKKIIDGMALSKMNTFHWHISDSQSFPFEMKSLPDMNVFGTYKRNKIYYQEEISQIVQYALERGIRVVPELDAPAHVGEGWQNFNVLVCFKKQPWRSFCVEPPCGQFDPTSENLYGLLKTVYKEMVEVFSPDIFHMGGDEVSVQCWNSSATIQNWMKDRGWTLKEEDFIKLWSHFQTEALKILDEVNHETKNPIILWSSRLTETPYLDLYLNPNRYIIQTWTSGNSENIKKIHERGFRTIISNYDALYLDCGGPGWVTEGQNWCSPYNGWHKIYENKLEKIAGNYIDLVLGAEAAIWTEQIDDHTILPRIFPRLSALAEILWTRGDGSWKNAESRMLLHRELLVQNEIPSETLQPEWCLQNENECPIDAF